MRGGGEAGKQGSGVAWVQFCTKILRRFDIFCQVLYAFDQINQYTDNG